MSALECWHRWTTTVDADKVKQECRYCGRVQRWQFALGLPEHVRRYLADETNVTQSAGQCTHDAFTPMTHHGPTWGAPCDDPPSYTP